MARITGSFDDGRITFGQGSGQTEAMVRDPVCRMLIEPSRAAAVAAHAGHGYFFCSASCKELFERDPEKYLPAEPSAGAAEAEH
jgi:Cu+-exporting ATPase